MADFVFTQNLRRHVNVERCALAGATIGEAPHGVFEQYPRLRSYLLDDTGAVRKHVVLLIDGHAIEDRQRLSDPLPPNADVFVMQTLSGD